MRAGVRADVSAGQPVEVLAWAPVFESNDLAVPRFAGGSGIIDGGDSIDPVKERR